MRLVLQALNLCTQVGDFLELVSMQVHKPSFQQFRCTCLTKLGYILAAWLSQLACLVYSNLVVRTYREEGHNKISCSLTLGRGRSEILKSPSQFCSLGVTPFSDDKGHVQ